MKTTAVLLLFMMTALAYPQAPPAIAGQAALTDQDIVNLVQAKVPPDLIIETINRAQSVNFSFSSADLVAMQKLGVPDAVIKAMAAKAAGRPTSPAPSPATQGQAPLSGQSPGAPQVQPPPYRAPEPPVGRAGNVSGSRTTPAPPELGDLYLSAGSWDLGMEGTVFIPHASASSAFGLLSARVGRMITDGNEVGADMTLFLQRDVQDIYLSGFYRYNFGAADSKVRPFFGAGAGVNIFNVSGFASASNLLARGEAGLRYFVGRNVSFDVAYNLLYVHTDGASFNDASASAVTLGFSLAF